MSELGLPTPTQLINDQKNYEESIIAPQVQKLHDKLANWCNMTSSITYFQTCTEGLTYPEFLDYLKHHVIAFSIDDYNFVAIDRFMKNLIDSGHTVQTHTSSRGAPEYEKVTYIEIRLPNSPASLAIHERWSQVFNLCIQLDVKSLIAELKEEMAKRTQPSLAPQTLFEPNLPSPQFKISNYYHHIDATDQFIKKINEDPHWSAFYSDKHHGVIITPKH